MRLPPFLLLATVGVVAAAWGGPPTLADEIHVCKDENGVVFYQGDPCDQYDVKNKQAARLPPPAAPKPPAVSKPVAVPKLSPVRSVSARAPRPTAPPRGLDARYETPERTWSTFANAVRGGDRTAVLSCLTASALEDFGPRADTLPLPDFLRIVSSITRVASGGPAGPFWTLRGDRRDSRPKWILFERTARGDWKISAI